MEYLPFIFEMILVGVGVGVLSAALGIGGGVLMVPAFVYFAAMDMNTAKGSSLLVITFIAAYNSYRMNRGEMRNPWPVILAVASGSIFGGYLGGFVTSLMSDRAVTWVFIALLAFAALRTLFLQQRSVAEDEVRKRQVVAAVIGLISGVVAGATGTGGGAILVPLALWAGIVSNQRVVALSNTVMMCTAAAGTVAHAVADQTVDMPWTYGLVNFSVAPLVLLGAVPSARLGRAINAWLSLPRRRVIMGALLLFIALRLVFRALA